MPSKNKLKTPEWVLEGYDSLGEYEKARQKNESHSKNSSTKGKKTEKKTGKTFKVRECPKCSSDDVGVLLGSDEGKRTGEWECHKCKWTGKDIVEKKLTEDEFLDYTINKEDTLQ